MHKQILLRAAALAGTVSLLGSTLMSVSAEEPTLGSTCSYRYDQIRTTTKDGTDDRRKAMNEFLQACPNYLQGTQRAGAASTSTISAAGTTTTDTIDCADFYRKAVELKQQNPKAPTSSAWRSSTRDTAPVQSLPQRSAANSTSAC